MTHPTEIPAFQAALGALLPADLPVIAPVGEGEAAETAATAATAAIADKIAEAQATRSPVPQCGLVLDALKDHVSVLGASAANVLAGAAHLVLTNGFLGRAAEADGVREAARAHIAALEA